MAEQAFFTEEQITTGLMAVVIWHGNASAASRYLKAEKDLDISNATLGEWVKYRHAARYLELREKFADQIEQSLIHEYRDAAALAAQVTHKALLRAEERLDAGRDRNPGRTAANTAQAVDTLTRNTLTLSGRPSQIKETRGLREILRSLAARGVLELPDSEVQEIESGE